MNQSLSCCNLVMTKNECFYCYKEHEELKQFTITYLYGVKACPEHYNCAIRDIRAEMHTKNIANIEDAIKNEKIAKFFDFLGKSFKIIRSNGDIEDKWNIFDDYIIPSCIYKDDGSWYICISKNVYDGLITKSFNIKSFLNPKLDYTSRYNGNFTEVVNEVCSELDKGIYLHEYTTRPPPTNYDSNYHFINEAIFNNNDIVRIVNLDKSS